MSKLLLSCDEFIYCHNGRYYASSQEKYDFFQRYLRVFDTLRIVCRCEEEREAKNGRVALDQDKRIEVIPVPMFHGPKQYMLKFVSIGKVIKNVTIGCDAAVLRIPSTIAMRVSKQVLQKSLPYACEVVYDGEDGWKTTSGLTKFAWKIIDKDMRLLCASADGVSCVTEHYLQRHYFPTRKDSFTEHYSSLSLPASFYGCAKSYPSHLPYRLAHVSNYIAYNGRKGHNEVIKALSLLKERGVKIKVSFVGRDRNNSSQKLMALANKLNVTEEVEILGTLNRSDIDNFLSNSDLFVFPTKAEGLPRVLIEAMSKGLPCVATPASGNPELIGKDFLVDYDNITGLADKIEELIRNPHLYEMVSKENYERSKEYESSVLEKRRDAFYKKLKLRTTRYQ